MDKYLEPFYNVVLTIKCWSPVGGCGPGHLISKVPRAESEPRRRTGREVERGLGGLGGVNKIETKTNKETQFTGVRIQLLICAEYDNTINTS